MVFVIFVPHVAPNLSLNHLHALVVDLTELRLLVELPVRAEVNPAALLVQTLDIVGEHGGEGFASNFLRPDLFDGRIVEDLLAEAKHILFERLAELLGRELIQVSLLHVVDGRMHRDELAVREHLEDVLARPCHLTLAGLRQL